MSFRLPTRSVLVVFALAAAPFIAACSDARPSEPDAAPAVAVKTVAAAETDWPAQFEAGGVLRAREVATIASRIMAPVSMVTVRPGDRVRRGQTLIRLDGGNLVAGAARASSQAGAARAGVAAADADVVTAESARTLAKTTHTRVADLAASRAATAQELDQAVAALAAADSQVTAARARRSQAAAALDAASAGQRAADADASYLTLTAPFDGIVTDRSVDPGSMAAPGTPLLVVDSLSSLQFEARLDAARAAAVSVGQTVTVRIDTDPSTAAGVAGRVVEVSRIDAGAHRFGVKIDIAPNAGWRAGLFGRARFAGTSRRTIAIPASAVVRRGQLAFVFVAADAHARLRAVSLGESAGDNIEILDGLSAGEQILLTPPAALADGARISSAGGAR